MDATLFPKPPPADSLPLAIWLDQTDRAEVGREAFFRGRDREFDIFRRAANSLREGRIGGGTMVFQGAPGAGKSALMAECMEAVRRHSTPNDPWVAVSIPPGSLRSPMDVIETVAHAVNMESERLQNLTAGTDLGRTLADLLALGRQLYQELSDRGGGAFGLSVGTRQVEGVTAGRAFQEASSLLNKFHIVICVDETQNTPVLETTREVLDCLHRDPRGIPLVVAFFGLSDTQDVLRECGLSRFADERIVNLEPLRSEDTACAIRDSLVTYDFPGSAEDLAVWVDRLTKLSQGWPQHINRVSVAAMRVLRDHSGQFEPSLLELALKHGQERKEEYYAGRLAAGSYDPVIYQHIALALEEHPSGYVSRAELRRLLSSIPECAQDSFEEFATNALHAGLLVPVKNLSFHYQIPIPSLGDYLRALPVARESSPMELPKRFNMLSNWL